MLVAVNMAAISSAVGEWGQGGRSRAAVGCAGRRLLECLLPRCGTLLAAAHLSQFGFCLSCFLVS